MKKISILGATESVGTQALEVISYNPESYSLCSISAGRNIAKWEEIIEEFRHYLVSVMDDNARKSLASKYTEIEFLSGKEGLLAIADDDADMLLTAIMGSIGLEPTLAAIDAGKDIALANKET